MRSGKARAAVSFLTVVLMLFALLPGAGMASDLTEYLTPGTFSIDGSFLQDGMNAPYSEGYEPSVEDGTLHVVLPLETSAEIDRNTIYCDLNLGIADISPFLYKNYDSIPVRPRDTEEETSDGEPELYVAEFSLPLKESRVDGVYPLGVRIRYKVKGSELAQQFTIDFAVTDGAQAPEPEEPGDSGEEPGGGGSWGGGSYDPGYEEPGYEEPGEPGGGATTEGGGEAPNATETALSEPKVILEKVVAAPDPCNAGSDFTVSGTLRNTNRKTAVRNMTVTYKSQTTDLIPNGTSTSYIESIPPNGTAQFAFSMKAVEAAAPGAQKIDVALAYEAANGTAYTASDEITVLVRQKIRLDHDQPTIPTTVFIGDTMNASLNLYNKGKGTLYNVTVVLDMPGIDPESSSFLGNMESGSSKTADIYASVVGFTGEDEGASAADDDMGGAEPTDGSAGFAQGEITDDSADAVGEEAAVSDTNRDVDLSLAQDALAVPAMEDGMYGGAEDAAGTGASGGVTEGNFIVTFEDEFGNTHKERIPVETDIQAPEIMDPGMMDPDMTQPEEPVNEGMPWWGWTLIAGGGAAAAAVPVVRMKRRKRAQELEAESAEDDDIY